MSDLTRTRTSVIMRACSGDTDEFARLYAPLAYSIARKRGLNAHDAEDIMQQSMLELLRLLPEFRYDRTRGSFKGLVKKIVCNRTTDLLRRRTPAVGDEGLERIADPEDALESLFEREWRKALLSAALERVRDEVKPSTFQSFQLAVLSQRPAAEVADTLGLTLNQVSQNKRRVLRRLRNHFEEMQDDASRQPTE